MCKENQIVFPAKITKKSIDSLIKCTKPKKYYKIKILKFDEEQIHLKLPKDFTFFDVKCQIECYHNRKFDGIKQINWFIINSFIIFYIFELNRKTVWRKYALKYKDQILTNDEKQFKEINIRNGSKIYFVRRKIIKKEKDLTQKLK